LACSGSARRWRVGFGGSPKRTFVLKIDRRKRRKWRAEIDLANRNLQSAIKNSWILFKTKDDEFRTGAADRPIG